MILGLYTQGQGALRMSRNVMTPGEMNDLFHVEHNRFPERLGKIPGNNSREWREIMHNPKRQSGDMSYVVLLSDNLTVIHIPM
jgi:hypothetical protein